MKLIGIVFNDFAHANQIAEASGAVFNPLIDQTIARVTSQGKLMGGVIFQGWTGRGGSIGMHSAGFVPRWVNRDMLWVCFDYPFNQLGVQKIFGQVPVTNDAALRFNTSLGFKIEARIKDVYPDGDMILMTMYRAQCRFLGLQPRNVEVSNGRKT